MNLLKRKKEKNKYYIKMEQMTEGNKSKSKTESREQ